MAKVKQNLSVILCAALGVLVFIFSAFAMLKADGADVSFNAYDVFEDAWEMMAEVDSTAAAIHAVQIVMFIVAGLMIVYGALACLKAFGIFNKFPESFGPLSAKLIAKALLALLAILTVVQLILLIMFIGDYEYLKLSAGIFIGIVFTVGAAVAAFLLDKE